MRVIIATLFMLIVASAAAKADPYRYCAEYGGSGDGGTNCYFLTIQQCQQAISGVGGFCRENGFYDGRPISTGEGIPQQRRRKH